MADTDVNMAVTLPGDSSGGTSAANSATDSMSKIEAAIEQLAAAFNRSASASESAEKGIAGIGTTTAESPESCREGADAQEARPQAPKVERLGPDRRIKTGEHSSNAANVADRGGRPNYVARLNGPHLEGPVERFDIRGSRIPSWPANEDHHAKIQRPNGVVDLNDSTAPSEVATTGLMVKDDVAFIAFTQSKMSSPDHD